MLFNDNAFLHFFIFARSSPITNVYSIIKTSEFSQNARLYNFGLLYSKHSRRSCIVTILGFS